MKKVRIGVMGVGRGSSMIKYCKAADNAELVAICDKWAEGLEMTKRDNADADIAYYTDFDAFIKHDMDAVVLANYADEQEGVYEKRPIESYKPTRVYDETAVGFGHGGSDFYSMWHFAEKIRGNPEADVIDVYEAMDMFLPGLLAYRSVLAGGTPVEIPDLRDKSVREKYRNDTACTDPKVAGDQLLPTAKGGTLEIGDEVYARMRQKWIEKQKK